MMVVRPEATASMSSGCLRAAVGLRHDEIRQQRRRRGELSGLARRFALRQIEMHRSRRQRGRKAYSAQELLAHGLGIDGRRPFDERRMDGLLIDALARAGLIDRRRVLVGDRDRRCAIKRSVGDPIQYVAGARTARRETCAWRARDPAPGCGQHRARDLLLHQDEAHVALARRVHELRPKTPDDEGCAGVALGC